MKAAGWSVAALTALLLAACAGPPPLRPQPQPKPPAKPQSRPPAAPVASPAPGPVWTMRPVVPRAIVTPQGRFHVVRSGETGIAIARAYGVAWRDMVALNGLQPPYVIQVGQRLRLPDIAPPPASSRPASRPPPPQSLEERARAFEVGIDDMVTGSEPARPALPRPRGPMATPPPRPLPAITGPAPRFRWPVEGRILSGFGAKPGGRFNDGVNLKASAGEPVRAAADGVVAYAGDAIPGFGNLVLIRHADGWVSAYGHAQALLVERGTRVTAGEVIARAGQTGAVSEPQVHFEVRRGRTPVDPVPLIGGR